MALCGLREIRGLYAGGLLGLALSALSGCASVQAKGATVKPPLDVPPPPPHVIELPAEPLEPVGEIPNPSATNPSTPRPPRPAPKPSEAKPEAKPDSSPTGPPATETPAPVPPVPAPAPQLQTPQTADTSTAAGKVRSTIDHARSSLNTVNYGPLSNDRKKAYKDAQLFMQQAEDALKEGNIVLAQAAATKAEKLAQELAGR